MPFLGRRGRAPGFRRHSRPLLLGRGRRGTEAAPTPGRGDAGVQRPCPRRGEGPGYRGHAHAGAAPPVPGGGGQFAQMYRGYMSAAPCARGEGAEVQCHATPGERGWGTEAMPTPGPPAAPGGEGAKVDLYNLLRRQSPVPGGEGTCATNAQGWTPVAPAPGERGPVRPNVPRLHDGRPRAGGGQPQGSPCLLQHLCILGAAPGRHPHPGSPGAAGRGRARSFAPGWPTPGGVPAGVEGLVVQFPGPAHPRGRSRSGRP